MSPSTKVQSRGKNSQRSWRWLHRIRINKRRRIVKSWFGPLRASAGQCGPVWKWEHSVRANSTNEAGRSWAGGGSFELVGYALVRLGMRPFAAVKKYGGLTVY